MIYGYGLRSMSDSIPPRTTWKSDSPRGSDRTMVGNQAACRFSVLKNLNVVMNHSVVAKPGIPIVSTETGLATMTTRVPVAGGRWNVSLDSPFHRTTPSARSETAQPPLLCKEGNILA